VAHYRFKKLSGRQTTGSGLKSSRSDKAGRQIRIPFHKRQPHEPSPAIVGKATLKFSSTYSTKTTTTTTTPSTTNNQDTVVNVSLLTSNQRLVFCNAKKKKQNINNNPSFSYYYFRCTYNFFFFGCLI
jgi:hypothetical protein